MKNDAYAYLLGMLEMKYGDLEDKRGCYVYNEETAQHLCMQHGRSFRGLGAG